jgi:hypothetical protein
VASQIKLQATNQIKLRPRKYKSITVVITVEN